MLGCFALERTSIAGTGGAFIHVPGYKANVVDGASTPHSFPPSIHGASARSDPSKITAFGANDVTHGARDEHRCCSHFAKLGRSLGDGGEA